MHVLFVASELPGSATYRYRSENLARCLQRAGHTAEVVYVGQSRVRIDADVVVLHRICTVPEGIAFAAAARQIGAVLVYSTDDTVYDDESFPSSGDPWDSIRAFAPKHREMLLDADAVLVSTDYLAQDIATRCGYTKPIFTIRNFLSDELMRVSEQAAKRAAYREPGSVTLGYMSGSATHTADLAKITPELCEILLSHEKVRLEVVGPVHVNPQLEEFARYGKFVRKPFVPWQDLPGHIAGTDINLAPLDTHYRFVQAKSEIKFLEAAAAGVPTVATNTAGFTERVPSDCIAYCTPGDGWLGLIRSLLDPDRRQEIARNAYTYVLTHGCEEAWTDQVATTFAEIAQLPRAGTGDTARGGQGVQVNYPFAPPKYLAKAVLRLLNNR